MASDDEKKGVVTQLSTFFPDAWAELKKVHAPTRQETIMVTLLVLGMIAVFGVFLGIADLLIGKLMQVILT